MILVLKIKKYQTSIVKKYMVYVGLFVLLDTPYLVIKQIKHK